jgi:hypothetical protein
MLPGAIKEEQLADGSTAQRCIYTPHSLRATTATLLLDANVDIVKVKALFIRVAEHSSKKPGPGIVG